MPGSAGVHTPRTFRIPSRNHVRATLPMLSNERADAKLSLQQKPKVLDPACPSSQVKLNHPAQVQELSHTAFLLIIGLSRPPRHRRRSLEGEGHRPSGASFGVGGSQSPPMGARAPSETARFALISGYRETCYRRHLHETARTAGMWTWMDDCGQLVRECESSLLA